MSDKVKSVITFILLWGMQVGTVLFCMMMILKDKPIQMALITLVLGISGCYMTGKSIKKFTSKKVVSNVKKEERED